MSVVLSFFENCLVYDTWSTRRKRQVYVVVNNLELDRGGYIKEKTKHGEEKKKKERRGGS